MRWDDDAPPFADWESFPFGDYLGAHNPDPGPIRPSTWATFKEAEFTFQAPGTPTASVFSELPPAGPGGAFAMASQKRTIARLSRFAERPEALSDEWFNAEFDRALEHLNLYLVGRVLASNLMRVKPVSIADLPPIITLTDGEMKPALSAPELTVRTLQTGVPHAEPPVQEVAPTPREQMDLAQSISGMFGPLMPAAEYIVRARHAAYGQLYRQAALDAGTGIELLVSAVLAEAEHQGWLTEPELHALAGERAYARKARNYFAPICGFERDTANGTDEFCVWWRHGYQVRNAVVHTGNAPDGVDTAHAVGQAGALLIATWKAVKARL